MKDGIATSGYLLMPPQLRRKFRSYANLVSCTPISAIDQLAALINGIQSNIDVALFLPDAPDLSAYPSVRMLGLAEWSAETILRDALAYGSLHGTRDFRTWNQVAEAINKLNDLENELWSEAGEDLIWYELFRIGHRQFSWQRTPTVRDFGRYISIYSHPPLQQLIIDHFGLSYEQIFRMCFVLADAFQKQKVIRTPIDFAPFGIDSMAANTCLEVFTTTLPEASVNARNSSLLDIDFAYRPSPFRAKPIVRLVPNESDTHIYCPIHRFLFERMTDGLYYDLVTRKDFSNPYGQAFQAYVEKVCRDVLPNTFAVLPEARYGAASKKVDSIDIIVSDESADVFVECKSRRVSLKGKTTLGGGETSIAEMDKIVDGIVQSYKSIEDGLRGKFPHWKPRSKPSYLLLAYVAPWFINSPKLREHIERSTAAKLILAGVSPGIMQEAPLTICSVDEFEVLTSVLCEVPIDRVLGQKVEPNFVNWELDAYLRSEFRECVERQRHRLTGLAEPARRALAPASCSGTYLPTPPPHPP